MLVCVFQELFSLGKQKKRLAMVTVTTEEQDSERFVRARISSERKLDTQLDRLEEAMERVEGTDSLFARVLECIRLVLTRLQSYRPDIQTPPAYFKAEEISEMLETLTHSVQRMLPTEEEWSNLARKSNEIVLPSDKKVTVGVAAQSHDMSRVSSVSQSQRTGVILLEDASIDAGGSFDASTPKGEALLMLGGAYPDLSVQGGEFASRESLRGLDENLSVDDGIMDVSQLSLPLRLKMAIRYAPEDEGVVKDDDDGCDDAHDEDFHGGKRRIGGKHNVRVAFPPPRKNVLQQKELERQEDLLEALECEKDLSILSRAEVKKRATKIAKVRDKEEKERESNFEAQTYAEKLSLRSLAGVVMNMNMYGGGQRVKEEEGKGRRGKDRRRVRT